MADGLEWAKPNDLGWASSTGHRKVAMVDSQGRDFFISYTAVNRPWAEWIAVQLETAGYTTLLQAWDFRPGSDFLHQMQQATSTAGRTIAVVSPAYFGSHFGEAEWRAAFVKDPTGEKGLLVPVRVQECQPPGLLASRVYIDLVDTDEATARRLLLAGVDQSGARPTTAPFPGVVTGTPAEGMRFPGRGPGVSNLPARNRNFSGRAELLEDLHARLQAESAAAVVPTGAVHGLGGVGKTQLALEFAHRFASDYDIAWWVPAELPTSATAALATLARRLGVEEMADQAEMVAALFDQLRGRDRWLLVYDNAEQPDQLVGFLPPGGGGQVLVTSRWSAWGSQASPLQVNVLARQEAIAFLGKRTGSDDQATLDKLAELLGDLPLALEEAAAYLEETGVGLGEYLELVRERARDLFGLDQPPADEQGDQRRVATVWSLSLDRVHREAPAAEALLSLCAFLAPDIPRGLPGERPQVLPEELARAVSDPLVYNRMLAVVGRYSLATVTPTTVGVHRLVQAVIQARLGEAGERRWAEVAVGLLRESFPNESWEVAAWPTCERLLPHVLAVTGHAGRLEVAGEQSGWLLDRASTYLRERGQYRQARPIAERALAVTEAALGQDDPEVAWRCDELGRVLRSVGDFVGARKKYERAVAISEAALGSDHPAVAVNRGNLGDVRRDLGDLVGARAEYERALDIGEAAYGPDHQQVAAYRVSLGSVLRALGDLQGARVQLERALAITEAALGPDHLNVASSRGNLGLVLQDLGDFVGAKEQFEQALESSEAALGPNHPDVAIRRSNLGLVLQALGELAGAKEQFERALAITEAALGPDHPTMAARRNNLGVVLQDLGDLAGAREQYERALAISEAALGPNHPDVAIRRGNLGRVLRALGDLAGARVQMERALEIGEAALGPDHPTVATARNNLGRVLHDLGDLEGARAEYGRALAIGEAALGPDHPDVATRRANLGAVLRDLGDLAGARVQFERALEIGEAAHGSHHPDMAVWRNSLGLVLQALGDLAGARVQFERALEIGEAALGPDHPTVAIIRDHLGLAREALQNAPPKGPTSAL
jgi:tetratricopeptide (TPR) repeat protein